MNQIKRTTNLHHASLVVSSSEPEDRRRALESLIASTPPDGLILRGTKTGDRGPLKAAFLCAVESVGNLFDDVLPNGPAKSIDLTVSYPDNEDHFVIDTDAGPVRISSIGYVGHLQINSITVPMLDIAEYRKVDSEAPISQFVSFVPQEVFGVKATFELHRIEETGEIHLVLHRAQDGA